ncbi:flagellar basal body P-ring formation chaperone FlgA [Sphingomonas sp. S2-65]|uniref:flagellar basal body P-ring formation chaperone FlgA n=1 Tax=Sphingomonas sp. S2-65 TaxID=2903960 RepID=UPI001F2B3174|nr:flagellar basal body P-ring formation chaperone FlgA [Sphingomonas sp. S2-65]UYY59695.1 flagellar basal body P-ring formation chaperone FlgA [Sphingomonas sp. S2-65]
MSLLLALALLAGPAEDVQVAVLGHAVSRGERIEAGDFTMESRSAAAARGALGIEDAMGMEATRNLAPGMIVRRTDVMTPQLVRRGEPVTIKLASGTLVITASGRALSGGAKGDMVRVVTNSTSRTLDGMVEGSGIVRVSVP